MKNPVHPAVASNAPAAPRSANGKKQKKTATLRPLGRVAVLQLAFEQMIDFVADGVQIIEAEIHNGIADVCYLVHFL